jgi:hypothetical protein
MGGGEPSTPATPELHATRSASIALGALALAVSAVLLTYLGLSVFSAPAADDYCYAVRVRRLGFLAAQVDWYQKWSGRYTGTLLLSAFGLTDIERTYPAIGAIALVLTWLAMLALVAAVAGNALGRARTVLAAGVLGALFLAGLPDVAQGIYWAAGSLTFQFANISFILLVAILVYRELREPSVGTRALLWTAAAALVVLIVGANEVSLVLTLLLLAAGTGGALRAGRSTVAFWGGLLGLAVLAAAVSALAPGNVARAGAEAANPTVLRPQPLLAAALFLPWTLLRLAYWSSSLGLWAATILLVGGTWRWARGVLCPGSVFSRRYLQYPAAWAAGLGLLNLIGFVINRYPLPERAESVVWLLFLLGWFPSAVILAHWRGEAALEPRTVRLLVPVAAVLAVSIVGSPNNFEAFKDTYRGYRYYREVAERRAIIQAAKAAGREDVVVPSLSRPPRTLLATEMTTDPENFRNSCVAAYHGLRSIRLGSPEPAPGGIGSGGKGGQPGR